MIHNFKNFSGIIEESLLDSGQSYINKAFASGPPILMSDGNLVDRREILKSVHNALKWISDQFITFYQFAEDFTIIYVLDNPKCPTMYVNNNMELVINARFVYENLKNDQRYIRAVLMHEMLHVFLDHINRGINYNTAHGLDSYNKSVQHDNNLAADAEVNKMLSSLGLLKKEEIVGDIGGVFLNTGNVVDGETIDSDTLSMETILDNKKLIDYLRSKFPCGEVKQSQNSQDNNVIHTTKEWDQGRIDAWNKCAELIKKYGKRGFIEALQKEGILDGLGDIVNPDKDKIMSMQFINIKSYKDFINESANNDEYTTYEDGFNKTLSDIVSKVMKSLDPNKTKSTGGNGNQPPIESGVKKEDLQPIDIDMDDDDDNGDGSKSPEDNYRSKSKKNSNKKDKESKNNKNSSGADGSDTDGSSNPDDFDPNDFDPNNSAIMDHIKDTDSSNKSKSGKGKLVDEISVGNTGGMMISDQGLMDDILKDSGYSEEQIENIKKITDKNRTINTKEVVEKKRADVVNKLKGGDPMRIAFERAMEAANEYKDLWSKVLKKFMNKHTEYAGVDIPGENIRWGEKRRLSIGHISPEVLKTSKEPQFINMYPDVSGSMNMKLLKALSEALYTYMVQFKYSGIKVAPWSSLPGSFTNIESIHKKNKSVVINDILACIEHGRETTGGGTDLADACVPQIVTANSENKKNVHIILTDGEVDEGDLNGLENYIINKTGNTKINKRCIWFIYTDDTNTKKMWKEAIKEGTLVLLNPKAFE